MPLPEVKIRDFRQGVFRKSAVNEYLAPEASVQHGMNVNFDTTVGNAVVRPGTTLLAPAVAAFAPLGLAEFVPKAAVAATPRMLLTLKGAATATIYYWNGTIWAASGLTALSNTSNVRFSQLGGSAFMANGVDAMKDSVDGSTWVTTNSITTDSVIPSLLFRSKGRMLASGYSAYPSRVYFSSIIDPAASPFITWSTNPTTGNWIDINPDDGSNITGFSETSSTTLVFKRNAMYRLNSISKTTDPQNIFNIGAVSQETIVPCRGLVYFFSGQDICRTDGGFPEQISRFGVQDWLDAIPQANWSKVAAGQDGNNVYFSIGNITLNVNQDKQKTYNNVVLKFSVRDQTWSVHSYYNYFQFFTQYTNTNGRLMYGADSTGAVQAINLGTTDNSQPIFYELITQELEFGERSHTKKISDKIAVMSQNGQDGLIEITADDNDPFSIPVDLSGRVAVAKDMNFEGNFFTLRWFGYCKGNPPVLEGITFSNVVDQGIIL
jgi:hypothetical protein